MNAITETVDTIIVGGGLSGMYAAHLLARKGRSFVVLEARERIGGRIVSLEHSGYYADLGPSWFWPEINPAITRLIQHLGLESYRQYEHGWGRVQRFDGVVRTVRGCVTHPPSFRISGGMMALIKRLSPDIPKEAVRCNHPVCHIERQSDGIVAAVGELDRAPRACFKSTHLILALPPRLAAATILFTPELPDRLTQAMLRTGTWMAGQAKFFALYDAPFWRSEGLSGQAFSDLGPLGEIHDGSNNDRGPFGLTGFIGIPAAQRNQQPQITTAILHQLVALFGEPAMRPVSFFYQDWARERFTATDYDQPPMREHPLYRPPAGQTGFWDGAVLFAGTETADQYGGYLEGALTAAARAVAGL